MKILGEDIYFILLLQFLFQDYCNSFSFSSSFEFKIMVAVSVIISQYLYLSCSSYYWDQF